jgi:hypothetical protein
VCAQKVGVGVHGFLLAGPREAGSAFAVVIVGQEMEKVNM